MTVAAINRPSSNNRRKQIAHYGDLIFYHIAVLFYLSAYIMYSMGFGGIKNAEITTTCFN